MQPWVSTDAEAAPILAAMRYALAAALFLLQAAPSEAAGRIPYGSRVGMEVTVTGVQGIGTANAVIHVRHTPENAKEFCVEYSQDNTPECVQQTLRDVRINDELRGDCRSGKFTTLWGDTLRYAGPNRRKGGEPKFIIIGPSGPLEATNASGYFTALSQLNALCPGVAGTDP